MPGRLSMEFLDNLSATLQIELSEPAERHSPNLLNEVAPASAQVRPLRLEARFFDNERGDERPLTAEELGSIVHPEPEIRMRSWAQEPVRHEAPNGRYFTLQELLDAIEETERRTRGESEWFGGIDVHHVFFEGLWLEADGIWFVGWGS